MRLSTKLTALSQLDLRGPGGTKGKKREEGGIMPYD